MPQKALPISPATLATTGLRPFRREYRDLMQRPLTGKLVLRGNDPVREGSTAVLPAQVHVPLVDGVVVLYLPPGEYVIEGELWTVDDTSVHEVESFTIE